MQDCFDFYDDDGVDGLSENEKARRRMNAKRAEERDIVIPPVANWPRRRKYRNDTPGFLRFYLAGIFRNEFTEIQLELIHAMDHQAKYGGYQAVAFPRGDGKTSITIGACIKGIVYGDVHFLALVAANGKMAYKLLKKIKYQIESNPRLAEDFPEICTPIKELKGATQKQRCQSYRGERTNLEWNAEDITFATIARPSAEELATMADAQPGTIEYDIAQPDYAAANGTTVIVAGLDGAIRGLLLPDGSRPDRVVVDDAQTRQSAASITQTAARREMITQDIMGLAGPDEIMSIMSLWTIIRKGDLADEFTDRQISPSWNGIRYKFLLTEPVEKSECANLWAKYQDIRRSDKIAGDKLARKAHAFYLANREKMDSEVSVSNPYRYISKVIDREDIAQWTEGIEPAILALPEFWQIEASPQQSTYNKIADMGRKAFDAEYQNDPSNMTAEKTEITPLAVMRKLSHLERGQVPAWAVMVVRGVDVGGRMLHWCDIAVGDGYRIAVINYGTEPVDSPAGDLRDTDPARQRQVQAAIVEALGRLDEQAAMAEYVNPATGEVMVPVLAGVDSGSGLHQEAVYTACKMYKRYRAIKGCGQGQQAGRYKAPGGGGIVRGRFYWASYQKSPHNIWLHWLDSDTLKNFVHQGFLTPDGQPGSISVYGSEAVVHQDYARHITAEIWCRTFIDGKGWVEKFDVIHGDNHFLDATAYAVAVAEIAGRNSGQQRAASVQRPVASSQQSAASGQAVGQPQRLTAEDIARIRRRA